jgi:tetratricopeptide (TPR) repeat protein
MQCPACAAENPDDYRFCDVCGAALMRCGQCGALGRPGAHFCGKCGAVFGDSGSPQRPPQPAPVADVAPAAVDRVLGNADAAQFLGRDRELALLIERFEQAKAGSGQIVNIGGESGVGKSRLVRELRHELELRGEPLTWRESHCSAARQTMPLRPLLDLVHARFAIADSDSQEQVLAKIDAGLESIPELTAEAPYVRYVLSVDPGEPAVAHMHPSLRRARVFAALRAVLAGAIEPAPAVIVLEDLQWMDRSTEEFLTTAMDAVAQAPLLLIVTHRTDYTAPFARHPRCTALPLCALSAAEALTLAGNVLGTTGVPAELATALADKAAGVPLRIEELMRTLFAVGVLQRDGGGYRMARPMTAADVPATVEGIVAARLDRLHDGAKRALQLCAVIGPQIAKRVLDRAADSSTPLNGALGELEHQNILERSVAAGDPLYRFRHAVIQDVAYHALPAARRKELHRSVAAAIEALGAERLSEHFAELARHWQSAEQWAKAMEYALQAGEQAAHIDANAEASRLYAGALAAAQHLQPAPEPTQLAALLAGSGRAANALGEYDDGVGHYTRALALAREAGDRSGELKVLLGMAELYDAAHRPDDAQSCCDQALALAGELEDRSAQAACLARRAAVIADWHGPTAAARRAAREALEIANQLNDSALRAGALIVLGSVLEWRADFDGCQRYLPEGAALSERTQSGRALGTALFHLGHSYMARGRYQQALRWYGGVREYALQANDRFWLARHPSIVAAVHLELFDPDSAVELAREGSEMAKPVSAGPTPRGHNFVQLGLAHLQRGESGAAEESLRRAWDLLDSDGWQRWCWHIPLLRARAELALANGDLDDALSYATQARQLAAQADARQEIAQVQLVLGEIAVAQERLPEAVQLLRGALTLAEHINAAYVLWRAGNTLGGILGHMGEDRAAETCLTQAAQTIEAIATELSDDALRASFTRADPVAEVYHRLGNRPLPAALGHR